MKLFKTAGLGLLALSAGATFAHADIIHFTGSTAYRGATIAAIKAAFNSGYTFGYSGSGSESGANAQEYIGTITVNGVSTPETIICSWTGSEGGIQTVDQDGTGVAVNFLKTPQPSDASGNPVTLTSTGVSGLADPTDSTQPSTYFTQVAPDVTMADTFQESSQFYGSYNGHTYDHLTSANSGAALANGIVGIVPFKWVASSGSNSSLVTGITSQQVRSLYLAGRLPLAFFTGTNADETKFAYAVGRDPDSGTRLSAFAETGVGALTAVKQFEPLMTVSGSDSLVTGTNSTISKLVLWPAETVNGISIASPNGGYNSGGKLAGALGSNTDGMAVKQGSFTSTGGVLISYLSTGDAATAINTALGNPYAAHELSFNGVTLGVFSDYNNATVLTEGKYTFWGYEHMYYRGTPSFSTVLDNIAAYIYNTTATVKVSSMKVVRAGFDGSTVNRNY